MSGAPPGRPRADRGLSLIELILLIAVLGIIVAGGSAAVIGLLRSDEVVADRTTVARGTRQLVVHLPSDVRSARVADIRTSGFDTTCLDPAEAAGAIGLQVDISHPDTTIERATYVSITDTSGGRATLWRVQCERPPGGALAATRRTRLAADLDAVGPAEFEVHPDGRVLATLRPVAAEPQVVQAQTMLADDPPAPTTTWVAPPTTSTPQFVSARTVWLNDPPDVWPGELGQQMNLNGPASRWVELSYKPLEEESDPDNVHIWATPAVVAGTTVLDGAATAHVWTTSALAPNTPGHGITAVLLDCPAVSSYTTADCTLIGSASASNLSVGPDVRALDFGVLTATIAADHRLVLKIGANANHATSGFTLHWGPPILPMAHLTSASRLVYVG